MGTNFYLRGHSKKRDMDPRFHVGKRSAAGAYCWSCRVTLCMDGEATIHDGRPRWHGTCPKCGATASQEAITASSGGRELGFNKSKPKAKTGVATCSSFTWAMEPNNIFEREHRSKNGKIIEDEYGQLYTLEEFRDVLAECPVQYRDSIGTEFC